MSLKAPIQLALALAVIMSGMTQAHDTLTPGATANVDDPYLWLEDIHGTRPMDWVNTQNAITEKQYASSPEFTRTRDRILEVLDSDARIPYVERRGDYLYNFWQDKAIRAAFGAARHWRNTARPSPSGTYCWTSMRSTRPKASAGYSRAAIA